MRSILRPGDRFSTRAFFSFLISNSRTPSGRPRSVTSEQGLAIYCLRRQLPRVHIWCASFYHIMQSAKRLWVIECYSWSQLRVGLLLLVLICAFMQRALHQGQHNADTADCNEQRRPCPCIVGVEVFWIARFRHFEYYAVD